MVRKTFTVECTMEERWIPEFYMFLAKMQTNGEMGHSELLGFYSDGDGDFRPTFKFSIPSPEGPVLFMNREEMIEYLLEELKEEKIKMLQGKENKYGYIFMLCNDMGIIPDE